MPRKKGAKRKAEVEAKNEEKPQKEEPDMRNYLDPESISQHLFCSICQEVYVNPQRAPCGHSYCKVCIDTWLANSKTCPDDRKLLLPSNLHHDFILENIIMDQKVACPNRTYGCSHVGPLATLTFHVKQCTFDPNNIPEFLKNELKQVSANSAEDADPDSKSIGSPCLSLKMRIFQAGGAQRENLMKVFDKPSETASKLRRLCDLLDDD